MKPRSNARVNIQLPVSVWGIDAFGQAFSSPAMITNMTATALVVHGLKRRMRVGDSLDVRMGTTKGQFRVTWLGEMSELGLERVDGNSFLPESTMAQLSQPAAAC